MITLSEVKDYLRLDTDAEDDYIEHTLIPLAAEMCENLTRQELPEELPMHYKQAMLITCAHYFEHRDGTMENPPSALYHLLLPYRKAAF